VGNSWRNNIVVPKFFVRSCVILLHGQCALGLALFSAQLFAQKDARWRDAYVNVIASLWKTQAAAVNAKLIDPSDAPCPSGGCIYQQNDISLYKDGFHLTSDGAYLLKFILVKSRTAD